MLSGGVRPIEALERVELSGAYGRVVGRDVRAREDLPRKDIAHFDGYAVRASDTAGATSDSPAVLRLRKGALRVGLVPKGRLGPKEAARVWTGGYLPEGSDCVVPVEEASVDGRALRVASSARVGAHVFPAGADVRRGEVVLRAGRTVMGQDLALLASLRIGRVSARRRPRVAILPTGNELTRDLSERRGGMVVESHSLFFSRLVEEAGGVPAALPIARDEPRALSRAIRSALGAHDVLLTLAGSSLGGPDLLEETLRGFGRSTTALVHGIRVNRGRVMGFAVAFGRPVVLLPGPIQGALNAFVVLAYPLIRHLLGLGWEEPPGVAATVEADWEATGRFKDFDQVVYLALARDRAAPQVMLATPSGAETEKASFLVSKNAYALVSGQRPSLAKGERIVAHLLPGFSRLD